MVSEQSVQKQLKRINFKRHGWGKGELDELAHILLPKEEIYECTNGLYEGGFALLVATDIRVLLIDKKPLNYLTVEDLRFDMINEMDYSHRLLGAQINISAGNKNLKFRSYNQPRLRKLIGHVQHCMADSKKKDSSHQEDQKLHLEQINQQLQAYMMAQQQQQLEFQRMQMSQSGPGAAPSVADMPEPVKPSPELSDYLLAQSLLAQHQAATGQPDQRPAPVAQQPAEPAAAPSHHLPQRPGAQLEAEMYEEGRQEVFGKLIQQQAHDQPQQAVPQLLSTISTELNPLTIFSKLARASRNRKFGKPAFSYSERTKATEPAGGYLSNLTYSR